VYPLLSQTAGLAFFSFARKSFDSARPKATRLKPPRFKSGSDRIKAIEAWEKMKSEREPGEKKTFAFRLSFISYSAVMFLFHCSEIRS
jgi:hypothetical protein